MAFKLRSGNKTRFKQMGGDKDIDAYNTTVRAEYEAQLQSHSDSTASYENQLERDKLQLDNADLWNTRNARQNILGFETSNFRFNKEEKKEYDKQRRGVKDQQHKLARENWNRGIYSKFNAEEGFEVGSAGSGGAGTSESADRYKGTKYRRDMAKLNNAEETEKLKPKSVPKPPVYKTKIGAPIKPKGDLRKTTLKKVPSISMKNIDMGQVSEPKLTKAIPLELVKNNAKYFTTERVGIGTHTSSKGSDNKANIKLKDQAGKLVFTGSQTEFTQKYGDYLKRGSKKHGQKDLERRFYIKN